MDKIFEYLDKTYKQIDFKNYWKSFLISMCATFLMAALSHMGVKLNILNFIPTHNAAMVNPTPAKIDPLQNLMPKLEFIKNDFKLKWDRSLIPQAAATADYNQANGYIVVDFNTGDVILEKDAEKKLALASLTKVMTSVVALDLAEPQDLMEVSLEASKTAPTKMGVVPGQRWTLEQLLNAAILTSANDAVEVIREGIDKKAQDPVFVGAMNKKAQILGMKNSHFENPQGFDGPDHYSSAADLAVLTHYALQNYPMISEIAKKDYQFYNEDENHKQADLYNWNGLIGTYPGVQGLKIGNTGNAKYTTIVVSEREGKKLLAVLLGAPGILERDLWASQLLDTGFSKLASLPEVNLTEEQLKAKYQTWKYFD
jgi:serine-type D-Ala-D-Ala carboxypeptidase (penicillin-binding protein 5/6)